MNDLKRKLAPIDEEAWREIETEVTRTLKTFLAGRRLVDFQGPQGWKHSAVGTGQVQRVDEPLLNNVEARTRVARPMVELRVPFELCRAELDSISRGAADADLQPAIGAARQLALAENRIVFHGYEAAGIRGACPSSSHTTVKCEGDFTSFPRAVSEGIEILHEAGIDGTFAVALQPEAYNSLAKTIGLGGYPIMRHVERLTEGPILWAPSLEGALVLSQRGGDFELTIGRDVSIGYLDHDRSNVRLYLEESLTFRVLTPEACVPIHTPS